MKTQSEVMVAAHRRARQHRELRPELSYGQCLGHAMRAAHKYKRHVKPTAVGMRGTLAHNMFFEPETAVAKAEQAVESYCDIMDFGLEAMR